MPSQTVRPFVYDADVTASGVNERLSAITSRVESLAVPLAGISSTTTIRLCVTGTGWIISDVTYAGADTIASDNSNKWTFQITNATASVNLMSASLSTFTTAITADTAYALTANQNTLPAASDVLTLVCTKTGTPTALTGVAVLHYTLY